jgi:hypothetical protein
MELVYQLVKINYLAHITDILSGMSRPDPAAAIRAKWGISDPKRKRQQKRRLDVSLGLGAIAVGLIFWLVPKSHLTVGLACVLIFGCLCHPTWNVPWIDRSLIRRLIAQLILIVGCFFLGWVSWPKSVDRSSSLSITAFNSAGAYRPGSKIAGITWRKSFSEVRVILFNPSLTDFDSLDILLRPNEPVAEVMQLSTIPDVSWGLNTVISLLPPSIVDPRTGETVRTIQAKAFAFDGGYRVRSKTLPRRSNLEIVMAVAIPSGKGLRLDLKGGYHYWAMLDIDHLKDLDEYFGAKRTATSMYYEGEYSIYGSRQRLTGTISLNPLEPSMAVPR